MCTKNQSVPGIQSEKDITFCHFGIFFAFALMIPKIKILSKMKKMPGDIILLHMCNINEDHMIYRHDRQNVSSFWATFCPFTAPPPP